MNFHSDDWIQQRVLEHYEEAKQIIPENQIVGIFLQGSQNYGLDYESSDIDTKLIVTPSLEDLIYNREPKSYTHVRANDEHIDIKDIRLYIDCFKKQNINFVEILFTKYSYINPEYYDLWKRLVDNREEIVRLSQYRSIKCIQGTAMNKYKALQHPYPSKVDVLSKHGYDPKQLHHMFRLHEFIQRYITREKYEDILVSKNCEFLKEIKSGKYSCMEATIIADMLIKAIDKIAEDYIENELNNEVDINQDTDECLNKVQYDIMYRSIKTSL